MNKMKIALYSVLFLVALGFLLPEVSTASTAAPCTPGTDCYCDKVKNVSSPIYDPNLLFCEDWEAPTLRLNQGVGNGAPWYGPDYDGSFLSFPNNRGSNSYFYRRYGLAVGGASWHYPDPASPTLGTTCQWGPGSPNGGSNCYGRRLWHPTNLWSANNYNPAVGIFTAPGDFSTWVPDQPAPTNASGGGTGVFDGNGSIGWIVPPGNTIGIQGAITWPRRNNFSITQALAYPTNLATSGLVSAPWKHHEFGDTLSEPFTSHNQSSLTDRFPFSDSFFWGLGGSYPLGACQAMLAGATVRKGTFYCNGNGLLWHPNTTEYRRSVDFPLGKWGCVQAQYTGFNSSNMGIKVWFNGVLIIDADHINDSALDTKNGIAGFSWNNYANTNQGLGATASTQMSGRFEDNMHITAGAPVSCSQIGFTGGGGDSTPPIAPVNLRIQ